VEYPGGAWASEKLISHLSSIKMDQGRNGANGTETPPGRG